jgi:hypothetical protein
MIKALPAVDNTIGDFLSSCPVSVILRQQYPFLQTFPLTPPHRHIVLFPVTPIEWRVADNPPLSQAAMKCIVDDGSNDPAAPHLLYLVLLLSLIATVGQPMVAGEDD